MSDYIIKEIGNLGLSYKTMITNITQDRSHIDIETKIGVLEDGLSIYMWDNDHEYRLVIASFELNKSENTFELHEVGDRMANPAIDYNDLKELVILGHDLLMRTEEELN